MSTFVLTTTDTQRRDRWTRLFGVDALPVKADRPRWRVERGAFGREVSVLAYDLDAPRLHWMARERFAAYVSSKSGHQHRAADIDGWAIKVTGYETVHETADSAASSSEQWQERAFSFLKGQGAFAYA